MRVSRRPDRQVAYVAGLPLAVHRNTYQVLPSWSQISGLGHLPVIRVPCACFLVRSTESTWSLSQGNLGKLSRAGLIDDTPLSTSGPRHAEATWG